MGSISSTSKTTKKEIPKDREKKLKQYDLYSKLVEFEETMDLKEPSSNFSNLVSGHWYAISCVLDNEEQEFGIFERRMNISVFKENMLELQFDRSFNAENKESVKFFSDMLKGPAKGRRRYQEEVFQHLGKGILVENDSIKFCVLELCNEGLQNVTNVNQKAVLMATVDQKGRMFKIWCRKPFAEKEVVTTFTAFCKLRHKNINLLEPFYFQQRSVNKISTAGQTKNEVWVDTVDTVVNSLMIGSPSKPKLPEFCEESWELTTELLA